MNDVSTTSGVLMNAARLALHAPSAFNAQPWRWRVGADRLELYADRDRRLDVVDPDDRLITMSCGAALHHARVAIAAAGHRPEVRRWPGADRPDLLARVQLGGSHHPTGDELDMAYAITTRHTDRRAYSDTPVPASSVDRLRAAAEAEGIGLYVVPEGQMPMLAIAAVQAAGLQLADPDYRKALLHWTSRPQWTGDGVPQSSAVQPIPRRVPVRDFAIDPLSGVDPGPGHDRGAIYGIFYGAADNPVAWLSAGEALSAVLLTAVGHGLSTAPMTDVIEVDSTRELLRQMLAGAGQPYLALRVGVAVLADAEPPYTPRRAAHEIIEYAERDPE